MTTVPTIEEMKAQIERRASTGWFALLYKTCAEGSKAGHFGLYEAFSPPDWQAAR